MSDSAISEAAPTWDRIRSGQASIVPRLVRERVVDSTRAFFKSRAFHEVETPLFVRCPGMEPYLDAFTTIWHSALGEHLSGFLTTSPEYAMKKILVAGLAPIFQICKSFRNGEEVSSRHNPEFTILEWYRTNADYTDLMVDCEQLFRDIASGLRSEPAVSGGQFDNSSVVGAHARAPTSNPPTATLPPVAAPDSSAWHYQGQLIDLDGPWERLTVRESFQRYAGVDPIDNCENLVATARGKGYTADVSPTWEQAFHLIFLNDVEPFLGRGRPTFLYDYPISMAALSRPTSGDPTVAERFELYVAGIEMANAFSELTDPAEQLRRLRDEQSERRGLGKTVYDVDLDFIRALDRGLPPSAGIALGMDRLAMFFADVATISDVLWFPADELFR
jgi:lysyl-tRNA synthetase class 2